MDDLSDDEQAVLAFLRDQLLPQGSHAQLTRDNRYLRAEMRENTDAIRDILEQLVERGYVERRTWRFANAQLRTYAYRLTEQGDQAFADY